MKIEVLYVPGCPNHESAVEAVMKVLGSESLRTEVSQVPVGSEGETQALRFPGSSHRPCERRRRRTGINLRLWPCMPALWQRDEHTQRSGDSRRSFSREKERVGTQ